MADVYIVLINERIKKQLAKIPLNIVIAFQEWVSSIETDGLMKTRQTGGKGLHDEALSGKWKEYRSVRLSKSYRAIYIISKNGVASVVAVEEISKHEY